MTVECAVELHPQGSRAGGVRERLFTGFSCVCCAKFGPDSQRYVQPPDEPPADQSVPLVEHWPLSLDDWRLTVSGSMADDGGIGGAAALGLRRHLWLSCGDGRLTRAPLLRVKGALGKLGVVTLAFTSGCAADRRSPQPSAPPFRMAA